MKLTIERAALLRALAMCRASSNGATPSRSSPTSCSQAEKRQLALSATDMDLEIVETRRRRRSAGAGATTAPAHTLYDIVRKLPEGAQIELADERRQGG